jgi:LysR family transcriptional activator of nhaA
MFRLGNELQDVLAGHAPGSSMTLNVGVAMVVPKLLAYRVLEPVLNMDLPVRMVCHEAPLVDLLADLSVHKLDVVLADSPVNPSLNIRVYNHLLGESSTSFFATRSKARKYASRFPQSLDGAPFLLPSSSSSSRRSLEYWFEQNDLHPFIVAEFEDRALMKTFGEAAAGIFAAPSAVEEEILSKYGVRVIGRSDEITERYYAISSERRIKHPAVSAITEAARSDLF